MKKRQLLAGLALVAFFTPVAAATKHYCDCGSGAAPGCTPGNNTNDGSTPALARRTGAQFKTDWQAAAAGDSLLFCQGGYWDGFGTGNMLNTNATKANPVVVDSYDASAVWTGGAGIKPTLANTSSVDILSLNKGTIVHTEGFIFRNLRLYGGGTNSLRGILVGADTDHVLVEGMTFEEVGLGIQCGSGSIAPAASGDNRTTNWTIRNNTFTHLMGMGILIACDHAIVEGNFFTRIGEITQDHAIYQTGGTYAIAAKTIASVTGNGTMATVITTEPHLIPEGAHFTVGKSGTTPSTFNATGGYPSTSVGVWVDENTFQYPSSATGTASVNGTYTITIDRPLESFVIRNNTISNGNYTANGDCNYAHIIVHGRTSKLLIEGNTITEDVTPSSSGCVGISVDSGSYSPPEDYEGFDGVIIRGNTVLNTASGITIDITQRGLVENNYFRNTWAGETFGFRHRSKNFAPSTVGSSTINTKHFQPDKITIRYNTAVIENPNSSTWAISMNGNVGDALTGTGHNLYGNVVVLGTSATTTTKCFDTQNMTLAMFDVKDYNSCYYLGASVPKWENTSSLATIQAGGDANKSDLNSTMAATASMTAGQPFLTSPTSSPATGASSALIGAGHPTLKPHGAWGGIRRTGTQDRGAYQRGASSVMPNAPTTLTIQ